MLTIAQDNELDSGATRIAPGMQRHCALTRTLKPVDEMVRFVIGPGSHTVPDIKRKLPGRGLWITGTRAAINAAIKDNVFARSFKQKVRVAADLAVTTEQLMERSALDALAIAGKAGQVIAGFAKVEAAIGRDDLLALIHAADAAADGKRKLDAALQRKSPEKSAGNRDHRGINRGAIGFGIEPPKCGTCSPACRPRERYFSRPRQALGALSDRTIARIG